MPYKHSSFHFFFHYIFSCLFFYAFAFTIVGCPFSVFNCSISTTQIANMWHILHCGCPRIYNRHCSICDAILRTKEMLIEYLLDYRTANNGKCKPKKKQEKQEEKTKNRISKFEEFSIAKESIWNITWLQLTCRMTQKWPMIERQDFHLSMMLRVESAIHLLFGNSWNISDMVLLFRRSPTWYIGILTQFHK